MAVERNCDWCGSSFETYQSQSKRFCSMDCRDKWMSSEFSGDGNPNHGAEKQSLECDHCGEEFERREKEYTGEKVFCSMECWVGFQEENREYDPTPYWSAKWRKVRKEVQERDGECVRCGADGSDSILDAHHKKPVREFDDPEEAHTVDNAVLLCRDCHTTVETEDYP